MCHLVQDLKVMPCLAPIIYKHSLLRMNSLDGRMKERLINPVFFLNRVPRMHSTYALKELAILMGVQAQQGIGRFLNLEQHNLKTYQQCILEKNFGVRTLGATPAHGRQINIGAKIYTMEGNLIMYLRRPV